MLRSPLLLAAILCLALALAPAAARAEAEHWYGEAGAVELPDGPVPAQGELKFDPVFLGRVLSMSHLADLIQRPEPLPQPAGTAERELAIFVEIFKFVQQYVGELNGTRDETYSSIGDFRAYYLHTLPEKLKRDLGTKNVWVQFEGYQTTTNYDNQVIVKTTGGGAGLRFELHPVDDGTFTVALLPIYGEKRDFNIQNGQPGGSDYIWRTSTGIAYKQRIKGFIEPGVEAYIQPQVIDFREFRVYAEAYIRFRLLHSEHRLTVDGGKSRMKISDIWLVPKVVWWKSTDQLGTIGDDVHAHLGDEYYKLTGNLYGLMNLEFHFGL